MEGVQEGDDGDGVIERRMDMGLKAKGEGLVCS